MSDQTAAAERLPALIDRAEETLDRIGTDGGDDGDGDPLEDLRDLYAVADEAADVLENVDVSELPDAVDGEDLVEAIEVGDIPDAIEDGSAQEAIDLKALLHAINFRELATSANLTELWGELDDVGDAIDDLDDDGGDEDGGLADSVPGVGGDDDDGLLSDDDGEDDLLDTDLGGGEGIGLGGMNEIPDEAYQVTIQEKAMEAVDEFREGVMEAHDKLKRLREVNREKMRRQHDEKGVDSRNPTAHSTMMTDRGDVGGHAAKHSTVPQRTRYTTAPSRRRIYGHRFDSARRPGEKGGDSK